MGQFYLMKQKEFFEALIIRILTLRSCPQDHEKEMFYLEPMFDFLIFANLVFKSLYVYACLKQNLISHPRKEDKKLRRIKCVLAF